MRMTELLNHVVHPTLLHLSKVNPLLHSQAACRLVTATAAAESAGDYLKQIGGGPARGLWQIEPPTARDILDRYLKQRGYLEESVWELMTDQTLEDQLVTNLALGAALCRLKYWMSPTPMPYADDAQGMGGYWKDIYNTAGGAGVPEKFEAAYRELFLE